MTDRLTKPIRKRLKITSQQTKESLSDIWSRLALRLGHIYTHFEKVESHLEKGKSYNVPIESRVSKLGTLFERGTTTNELIIGAMAELAAVISDQAEEYSQAQIEMGMMKADMAAQKAEFERAQKTAKKGRYDAANIATLGPEVELFTLRDVETIGVNLVKVHKPAYIQALIDTDGATWQELSAAFEAAREARG